MKFFGLPWLGHVGYLFALIALVFYGKNQFEQAVFVQQDVAQVQQQALAITKRINLERYNDIERQVNNCRTRRNQEILHSARQVFAAIDIFSIQCDSIAGYLQSEGKQPAGNWEAAIVADYYQLSELLKSEFKDDSIIISIVNHYFVTDYIAFPAQALTALINTADNISAAQLLQNMRFKANVTLEKILSDVYEKMEYDMPLHFDHCIPAFSFPSAPRAGLPFKADVFLLAYPADPQSWIITAKVNNQAVPMEKGVAHYQTTFHRPGNHTLPVSIEITNPLTGEMKEYRKHFTLPIAQQ